MKKLLLTLAAIWLLGTAIWLQIGEMPGRASAGVQASGKTDADMMVGAQTFLNSLPAEKRSQTTFDFKDEERFNFHFIPRERKGLPFKSMTPEQRKTAHAFLSTGLSPGGYLTATHVMYLEHILWEMENQSPRRDPDLYFFSVFGLPSPTDFWGWRLEGHHLSLNYTLSEGRVVSSSPAFFGANPAEVRAGPHKGLRVLGQEEDMARELVKSLEQEKQDRALISDTAFEDILSGARQDPGLNEFEGISGSELSPDQTEMLMSLIELYANRFRKDLAENELQRIRSGLDDVYFAWAGGIQPRDAHYYRIHGPHFLIEYDNIQNDANHIHSVWRDLKNDFGRDVLKEHYASHRHE